jgi:hypothetical protein
MPTESPIPFVAAGAPALEMFVVTSNPSDYPGKIVVRRWIIWGPEPRPIGAPVAVEDSLDAARAKIPPGLDRLTRHPSDDPVIVESWI